MAESDPDDMLVFIDGDALPVRPIAAWMTDALTSYPLVAVRRTRTSATSNPTPVSLSPRAALGESEGVGRRGAPGPMPRDRRSPMWVGTCCASSTNAASRGCRSCGPIPTTCIRRGSPSTATTSTTTAPASDEAVSCRGLLQPTGQRAKPTSTSLEGYMIKAIRQPALLAQLRPRHLAGLPLAAKMSVIKQLRRRELKRREREFSGEDRWHRRSSSVCSRIRSSTASSIRRPWRNR